MSHKMDSLIERHRDNQELEVENLEAAVRTLQDRYLSASGSQEQAEIKNELITADKKLYEVLFESALVAADYIRCKFVGDGSELVLDYDWRGGTSGYTTAVDTVLAFTKTKRNNAEIVDNDIYNINKLLKLTSYYNEYTNRCERIYHKDPLGLREGEAYNDDFGYNPEYLTGSEPYFYGSPEAFVANLLGMNIYEYENLGDLKTEDIIEILGRISDQGRKELIRHIVNNYNDIFGIKEDLISQNNDVEGIIYGTNLFINREAVGLDASDFPIEKLDKYISDMHNLMHQALEIAIKNDDKEEIEAMIFALGESGREDLILPHLVDESYSEQERLAYCVGIINTYGFMPGINFIKRFIGEESTSENVRDQLKWVFSTLHGEEDVIEIQLKLSDVYKRVNFHEYALNNMELTEYETDFVMDQIAAFAEQSGVDQSEVVILDIGAGTGRHSLMLAERGQKRVVAFEFESAHVDKIKSQAQDRSLDLRAIEGDWNMLREILSRNDVEKVNIAFALNRTIMHNNTPDSMLHFFDEVNQVLSESNSPARIIFDIPDITEGYYLEVTQKLRQNLKSHGVKDSVTMHLFDGPSDDYKFDRMALTDEQFRLYAQLFGMRVVSMDTKKMGDGDRIKNNYYVLEKESDYKPWNFGSRKMREIFEEIGIKGLGIDWDMPVKSWRVSLQQALRAGAMFRAWEREIKEQGEAASLLSQWGR